MNTLNMYVLLLIAVIVCQVTSRAVNISSTWTLPQEGFPHFFRYFKNPAAWDEAKNICESFQAELLTVETNERRDAARAYLKELDVVDNVWLGLRRNAYQSPFMWTGGQGPLVGDGFWQEPTPAEPETLCVTMNPLFDYRWLSTNCYEPQVYSFVCQLPVPQWATGDKGCLLQSLPSLTVTYLPEAGVIELLSDCGLSGTKRIACKGQESRTDLTKRLSCDRDDDSKSSTQGWTEKTPHSAGHRWGTTTISDWVSSATSRSYGTRHKRESGGTSTSTDTSLLHVEEGVPTITENSDKSTADNSEIITEDGYITTHKIHLHENLASSVHAGDSFKNEAELSEAVKVSQEFSTLNPLNDLTSESMVSESIKERAFESRPLNEFPTAAVTEDVPIMELKENYDVTTVIHLEKQKPIKNAQKEMMNSFVTEENLQKVPKDFGRNNSNDENNLISPTPEVTSTTGTPSKVTSQPTDVPYQINPPLTLRSGMNAARKEVISEDITALGGNSEIKSGLSTDLAVESVEVQHDKINITTETITTEENQNTNPHGDPTNLSEIDALPETTDILSTKLDLPQTPRDSYSNSNSDIELLPASSATSHWSNLIENTSTAEGNEVDIASDGKLHITQEAETLKNDKLKAKTSCRSRSNQFMKHESSENDEIVQVNYEETSVSPVISINSEEATIIPIVSQTNIPIIVMKDSENPDEVGETEKDIATIIETKQVTEYEKTNLDITVPDTKVIKSTSYNAKNQSQPKSEKMSINDSGQITVLESEPVREPSRPSFEEPLQNNSVLYTAEFTNSTSSKYGSAESTTATGKITTDSSPSTNEPNDTIFETTTHSHSEMPSAHDANKFQEFQADDEAADEDGPKRSNRGRHFSHSNPVSFYPYFINRVLG